jgi:hypothetical protein
MIKHKDTIIQVTFTIDGVRYEKFALQSADYVLVKTINPYGYKFVDVEAVLAFLAEEKELILRNSEDDHFSYLKHFVLGDAEDGNKPDHKVTIWPARKKSFTAPYNSIKIEKAVAFDKATDKETDITKEFCDVWYIGLNPPKAVRRRGYKAVIKFPATWEVRFMALDNLSEAQLKRKALEFFWQKGYIKADCYEIAEPNGAKVESVARTKEDD